MASSVVMKYTLFSVIMDRHHCTLITVISPQPNSLLLQPRGSVVRAEQRGNLLWLAGRWSSCHHGGLLCQQWGAPSWHGGHRYGRGQQPHHLQRKHLPDPWRKYGGKPQPHITLIPLLLSHGEQRPYQCFCVTLKHLMSQQNKNQRGLFVFSHLLCGQIIVFIL